MSIGAEIGAAAASSAMGSVMPIVGMVRDKKWRDEDIARADRLTKEGWQREDTAVQRRMADLKAGGINPLLAAGSAANSSQPLHSSRPPQPIKDVVDPVMARENIATSRMQRQLLQAQIDGQYGQLAVAAQDADTRSSAQKVQEAQLNLNRLAEERNSLLAQKSLAKSDADIRMVDKRIDQIDSEVEIAEGIYGINATYADRAQAPYNQQPTVHGALLSTGTQRTIVNTKERIRNWALGGLGDANSVAPIPNFRMLEESSKHGKKMQSARAEKRRQSHGYYY